MSSRNGRKGFFFFVVVGVGVGVGADERGGEAEEGKKERLVVFAGNTLITIRKAGGAGAIVVGDTMIG